MCNIHNLQLKVPKKRGNRPKWNTAIEKNKAEIKTQLNKKNNNRRQPQPNKTDGVREGWVTS